MNDTTPLITSLPIKNWLFGHLSCAILNCEDNSAICEKANDNLRYYGYVADLTVSQVAEAMELMSYEERTMLMPDKLECIKANG